ncbi:hypothetical protein IM288_17855 [Enterobacter cloacae complex sp. P32C]|uniref:hypothetical protein n=1 Tax=Enterobacter cloacae complex sp. P32C TaxID=2779559 RepID=UPI0018667962|nr:hypothetical protein [Enterobacter cloacae complex sp. P32C]MBE3210334.1 hypothetical protein [Enterobacter cloacae complex sp. P32C]
MVKPLPAIVHGLLLLSLLVSGCSTARKVPATVIESAAESTTTPAEREAERMALCLRELDALKNISPEQYDRYQTAFSRLMSGAAKYAGVRTKVNLTIQDTIDARYRYQVTLLCSDVSLSVMNGLLERKDERK